MSVRQDTKARIRERELGLERQRRITRRVFVAAVGGCAAIAGLAGVSKATHGTPTSATINKASTVTRQKAAVVTRQESETSDDEAPAIVAPVTPVTPTPVAPVTSSGGS